MGYQIIARGLNDNEVIMAQRVFANTFTDFFLRNKVMLANGLGAGDRPFTSIDIGTSTYRIYIGPGAWDPPTLLTLKYKSTFIHEMTHVWQMHNQSWFGAVWASSLLAQLCRQGMAYNYGQGNLNKDWDSFNVEEQAQIVEDWFKQGLTASDPRYHYVRDSIRRGNPGYIGGS
jgi:hypothetical protein